MITVRDDDVLLPSSQFPNPMLRFKQVHEIIVAAGAHHVPGILCGEFRHVPGAEEYVREKMAAGEMTPQVHGWAHRAYHTYPTHRIVHHLNLCLDYFDETWQIRPTKFFTPWGGDSPEIRQACAAVSLEWVGCDDMVTPRRIKQHPKGWVGKAQTQDIELFIHWWEGGPGRLETSLKMLKGRAYELDQIRR